VPVTRKRRTLVAESGAWNQSNSFRAEDFGHVPEGLVELEIFINAIDGAALGHRASVGPAAPLEFDPADRWQYGISMDLVGKLVEAVSDQSLEIYFGEIIFAPLGMVNAGFLISSAQKRRVATMHNRQPDGSVKPAAFEMNQRPELCGASCGHHLLSDCGDPRFKAV
jgi:CubicO group peptidase (beta-lactamase class C family)